MSMTSRNCAGVSREAGTAVPFPALLTRMSTCPNSLIAASTTVGALSGSATSAATVIARRPACSTTARVASRRSTRRAASTRSAPASASALANATPRPEEAPVTIATRSSRRKRSSTVVMCVLSGHRPVNLASRRSRDETLAAVLAVEQLRHVGVEAGERRRLSLEPRAMRRGQRGLDAQRRRLLGDHLGELDRARELPARLDDLLDQPDAVRLGGVVLLAGQQPSHRIAPAAVAREPDRRAAERVDPPSDLQL